MLAKSWIIAAAAFLTAGTVAVGTADAADQMANSL